MLKPILVFIKILEVHNMLIIGPEKDIMVIAGIF